jgi:hypothetical protein
MNRTRSRRALLHIIELMPQQDDFGFQPPSRLEGVAQHADEKETDRNRCRPRAQWIEFSEAIAVK